MSNKISAIIKARFYRQLSKLIKAGFTLSQALEKISLTNNNQKIQLLAKQIEQISQNFHDEQFIKKLCKNNSAKESHSSSFEIYSIKCGSLTGRLEKNFSELSLHFETLAKAKRNIINSLYYPLFILIFGALACNIGVLLKTGILAFFAAIFKFFAIFSLFLAPFLIISYFFWKNSSKKIQIEKIIRKIPFISSLWQNLIMLRFCQSFEILWSSGNTLYPCLENAGSASSSQIIHSACQRMIPIHKKTGSSLSELFATESKNFPKEFIAGLESAEQSGEISSEFLRWSTYYREIFTEKCQTYAGGLAKTFSLLVMLYIAWHIIKFYTNYWGNMTNLLNF